MMTGAHVGQAQPLTRSSAMPARTHGMRLGWLLGLSLLLVGCLGHVRLSPQQTQARELTQAGLNAYTEQKLELAEQHFTKAVTLDPLHAEARLGLGATLIRLNRDDEAETHFKEVVQLNPRSVRGWTGLGLARSGQGNAGGAVKAFEQAVALEPQNAEARVGLGMAYLEAGQPGKALDQARALEAINPKLAAQLKAVISPF